ncbi:putative siderophore-interacting protein [Gordonia spumicola]|uniref:Putative siderophore-interacting protein n=1 Tax=Gordonia spumicola TaxID=589161 RepID=A0A7I9V7U6_9ACTN|nr:siderophore-interacting protein [Gordonia spumicola]GEE01377.1 putative siderophore-interacting protein [Gordonia spumicola]
MSENKAPSRGWQGAIMKAFRADDFELTVTATERVTDHYLRLAFSGGGLLSEIPLHPTMWVRGWFPSDEALHQRGYTLVDPDPESDTFHLEFTLHDGPAARWAQNAVVGDRLSVSVMGSKFDMPDPAPTRWLIAGDTASLAAINSLLDAFTATGTDVPATVWFECVHDDDNDLPIRVRPQDTVHRVRRERDGRGLVETIRDAAFDASGAHAWVALDAASTRAVTSVFRSGFRLGRSGVKSRAYWRVGKPFA